MSGRPKGFTLVELLIVISVIMVLAALLFPVFASALERARRTKCINNLKQLASAIQMYEDDYAGMVMPVSGTGEAEWGYMWQDIVDPYVKQLKGLGGSRIEEQGEIFMCPSAPVEQAIYRHKAAKTYGYNPHLTRFTRLADVRYAALILRLTECSDKNPDDKDAPFGGGSWFAPLPDGSPFAFKFDVFAPGWHNGMSNVLWVDGHVSTITRQRVMLTDNSQDPNVWCRLAPKPGYTPEG